MSSQRRHRPSLPHILVVLDTVVVLLTVGVVALWAFADRWPWPSLLPETFSTRGIAQVLFSNHGQGLAVMGGSVGIAFATAVLTTVVAACAARAICDFDWRGRNVFNFVLLLPFLIPATVFAMGVQVLFIKVGLARTVPGVVLAHSIIALPYAVVILVDVTRAAGTRLEEAAHALGAGRWSTLVHVTIPSLIPGILSSMSMCYIMSFSQYFLTLLIGGGAVRTFATVLFPYLSGGDRTIASAYGLVFIVSTFVVFLVFEVLLKRFGVEERRRLFG